MAAAWAFKAARIARCPLDEIVNRKLRLKLGKTFPSAMKYHQKK